MFLYTVDIRFGLEWKYLQNKIHMMRLYYLYFWTILFFFYLLKFSFNSWLETVIFFLMNFSMVSTAAYRKLYLARYILLHIFIRNDPSKNLTLCGTYEQCSKNEKKSIHLAWSAAILTFHEVDRTLDNLTFCKVFT